MKPILVSLAIVVFALLVVGCSDSTQSPQTQIDSVPPPQLVPYTNIPYPFPDRLYRLTGEELLVGPVEVLENVLNESFSLRRAWYPQISICGAVFLDELIIELTEPDDAIHDLGFTSDFSGTSGACSSHWDEYNFVR
jgi:hypothetical protein